MTAKIRIPLVLFCFAVFALGIAYGAPSRGFETVLLAIGVLFFALSEGAILMFKAYRTVLHVILERSPQAKKIYDEGITKAKEQIDVK